MKKRMLATLTETTKEPCLLLPQHPAPPKPQPQTQTQHSLASPPPIPLKKNESAPLFQKQGYVQQREAKSLKSLDLAESEMPLFNERGERLYCVCRKPYNPRACMIGCDECDDWFHCRCVRIPASTAETLEQYVCPRCTRKKKARAKEVSRKRQPEAEMSPGPKRQRTDAPHSASKSEEDPKIEVSNPETDPSAKVVPPSESHENTSSSSAASPISHTPPHDTDPLPNQNESALASSTEPPRLLPPSACPPEFQLNPSLGQCGFRECRKVTASKYCGDECATKATREQFRRRQELFSASDALHSDQPATPPFPMGSPVLSPVIGPGRSLDAVRAHQAETTRLLAKIEEQTRILQCAVERANQIDMVTCGCPIEGTTSFCEAAKECVTHLHWQSLQRSKLLQEKIFLENTLKRLRLEENLLLSH